MYAIIETKGATQIVINIPLDGAEKSLPMLAGMFEKNATFINKGWREINLVRPEITVVLGNDYHVTVDETDMVIQPSEHPNIIDNGFVLADQDVFISNRKQREALESKISSLNTELQYQKDLVAKFREQVDALTSLEEA